MEQQILQEVQSLRKEIAGKQGLLPLAKLLADALAGLNPKVDKHGNVVAERYRWIWTLPDGRTLITLWAEAVQVYNGRFIYCDPTQRHLLQETSSQTDINDRVAALRHAYVERKPFSVALLDNKVCIRAVGEGALSARGLAVIDSRPWWVVDCVPDARGFDTYFLERAANDSKVPPCAGFSEDVRLAAWARWRQPYASALIFLLVPWNAHTDPATWPGRGATPLPTGVPQRPAFRRVVWVAEPSEAAPARTSHSARTLVVLGWLDSDNATGNKLSKLLSCGQTNNEQSAQHVVCAPHERVTLYGQHADTRTYWLHTDCPDWVQVTAGLRAPAPPPPAASGGRTPYGADAEKRKQVEEAAMAHAKKTLPQHKDVSKENLGWDITVQPTGTTPLYYEVKGLAADLTADQVRFVVTPNEYKQALRLSSQYRFFVVVNALDKGKRNHYEFSYEPDALNPNSRGAWVHRASGSTPVSLAFEERIGAIARGASASDGIDAGLESEAYADDAGAV